MVLPKWSLLPVPSFHSRSGEMGMACAMMKLCFLDGKIERLSSSGVAQCQVQTIPFKG